MKFEFVCYCISLELEQWKLFSNNFQIRRSTSVSEMVWSELELQLWSIFLQHCTRATELEAVDIFHDLSNHHSPIGANVEEKTLFMRTLVATSLREQSILVKSLLSSLE